MKPIIIAPLVTLALAGGGAVSVAGPTAVSAQESTPMPSPVPTSTITIRFVRAGEPVTITGGLSSISADGIRCLVPIPAAPVPISVYSANWPAPAESSQPPECSKGPPTTLRFEFNSEFGLLFTEFVWTGDDVTMDIEVPESMTPTPTSTPPVGELPATGGPPVEDSAQLGWVFVLIAASFVTAVSVALLRYRRT